MQTDQYLLMENAIASGERPNEVTSLDAAMTILFHIGSTGAARVSFFVGYSALAFKMRLRINGLWSNLCSSGSPPRLPFSVSGVALQSVASAGVAVGGGRWAPR